MFPKISNKLLQNTALTLSHFEGEIATPKLLGNMEALSEVEQTPLRFDNFPCHSQAVERTLGTLNFLQFSVKAFQISEIIKNLSVCFL